MSVMCIDILTRSNFSNIILVSQVSDRPDGLFATVVVDEQGIALGLVYSSKERYE